jgi:hypothetical protein
MMLVFKMHYKQEFKTEQLIVYSVSFYNTILADYYQR